jgi:hypothetical protein
MKSVTVPTEQGSLRVSNRVAGDDGVHVHFLAIRDFDLDNETASESDSDNDRVSDLEDWDLDNDGIPDYLDFDADGDGKNNDEDPEPLNPAA